MSETAGAPSSSSGVEVPQPVAVEPDPMVRPGLKKGFGRRSGNRRNLFVDL